MACNSGTESKGDSGSKAGQWGIETPAGGGVGGTWAGGDDCVCIKTRK